VVRHALVQRIVRAYESTKPQQQELPLEDAIEVGISGRDNQPANPAAPPAKPQ
jgi:hypothetical protein